MSESSKRGDENWICVSVKIEIEMNFEDYESLPTNDVILHMNAGAIAGIMEHCVMYPLDSVKVLRTFFLHSSDCFFDFRCVIRNGNSNRS